MNWRVLLGCHLAMMGAVSPAFAATFGLFLSPMSTALQWSRGEVALGFSTFLLVCACFTPLAGSVLDRFGPRIITLLNGVLLPGAMMLFALAPPLFPRYLAAGALVGVIGSFSLPVTYVAILNQWFDRKLGLAIALSVSGLGTGAIVNPFIATHLIQHFGWRQAWMLLALWSAVLGLGGRLLIPWHDDRSPPPVATTRRVRLNVAAIRTMLADGTFWLLTVAFLFAHVVTLGVFSNIASAMKDRGLQGTLVATVVAAMGISSLLGRLCGGALLDRVQARWVGSLTFALQGLGCVILAFTSVPALAVLGAALASLAVGVEADMIPFVIRRRYEAAVFGRVYGIMYGLVQMGGVVGPSAVAFSFDWLGNYTAAFSALSGLSATAAVLMALAYDSRSDSRLCPVSPR